MNQIIALLNLHQQRKICIKKAPDLHGVFPELIRECSGIILKELASIIQTSSRYKIAYLPDELIDTLQFPIPQNKSTKGVTDCRPISLCQTDTKIYAKILLKRLDKKIGNSNIPSCSCKE